MKKSDKKLTLAKETLSNLDKNLKQVAAANSVGPACTFCGHSCSCTITW